MFAFLSLKLPPVVTQGFVRMPKSVMQLATAMLGLHLVLVVFLVVFVPPVQSYIKRFEPNQTRQIDGQPQTITSLYLNNVQLFVYSEWMLDLVLIAGLALSLLMLFRSQGWVWAIGGLCIFSLGLAVLYLPVLPMLYIPIVLRLRFSTRVTALICFLVSLAFIALWSAYFLSLNQAFLTLLLGVRQFGFLLVGLLVCMLIFTAYMLVHRFRSL